MSCCGKARAQAAYRNRSEEQRHPFLGTAPGQVEFEYLGTSQLTARGPWSNRTYVFRGAGARLLVDIRDARSLESIPSLRRVGA